MAMLDKSAATKTAVVIGILAAIEGGFVLAYPHVWLPAAFRNASDVSFSAWIATLIVTVGYVVYSIRGLPVLKHLLGLLSPFKVLSLVIALPSSILEEVFFRSSLMNLLAAHHQNVAVQVIASGISFGVAHALWGLRGGIRAVFSAVSSTTFLGLALALVFVIAGRIVFPCVVAHFAINLVLEPWLIYAYVLRTQSKSLLGVGPAGHGSVERR